jgi:2-keto-4-pentenoate hydratase
MSTALSAITRAADRLDGAARSGTAVSPVRDLLGSSDLDAAYSVQRELTARRLLRGGRIVGHKIGLTSPAVQEQLGVSRPDTGLLFADMAVPDAGQVAVTRLLQPKIEAEVAFVLGRDLADGPLDIAQCRGAVDYAATALEIVDSRVAGWDISITDTIADNASAGLFVLGQQRVPITAFEPRDVEMTMTIDGEVVSKGTGAACLDDPLAALSWLARTAREFGEPLRAGHIVLSGALGPMAPVAGGNRVAAKISVLGTVSVYFTSEDNA